MRAQAQKMLLIVVDDVDRWHDQPLYEAIVRTLRKSGIAGATVWNGIAGYGGSGRLHHRGLFGVSDEKPVVIFAVDDEVKLRGVLPQIVPMAGAGIVLLQDAEVFTKEDHET